MIAATTDAKAAEKEKKVSEEAARKAQAYLVEAEAELKKAQEDLVKTQAEIESARNEQEKAQREAYKKAKDEAIAEAEAKAKQLQQDIEKHQYNMQATTQRISEAERLTAELNKENKAMEEELASVNAQIAAEAGKQKLLQERFNSAEARYVKAQAAKESADAKATAANAATQANTEAANKADIDAAAASTLFSELRVILSETEQAIEEQNKRAQAASESLPDIKQSIDAANESIEESNKAIARIESEVAQARAATVAANARAAKARAEKEAHQTAEQTALRAQTVANNNARQYNAEQVVFEGIIHENELKIKEAEAKVRIEDEKAAQAEAARLTHVKATNEAVAAAKEEVRKMEAKVAEYLSFFKQAEIEVTQFVEKNLFQENAADEAAKQSVLNTKNADRKAADQNANRVSLLAEAKAQRETMVSTTDSFVAGEREVTAAADGESNRLERETQVHRRNESEMQEQKAAIEQKAAEDAEASRLQVATVRMEAALRRLNFAKRQCKTSGEFLERLIKEEAVPLRKENATSVKTAWCEAVTKRESAHVSRTNLLNTRHPVRIATFAKIATDAAAEAAELENAARTLTEQLYANGKFEQKDVNYGQIDPKWREAIVGLAREWAAGPCPPMPNEPESKAVDHTRQRKLVTMVGPGQLMLTHLNYYYMSPCSASNCHVETRKVSEVKEVAKPTK